MLSDGQGKKIIRLSIIVFWWLFWLFNVIDKIIPGQTFLWVGKDRFAQFVGYFSSIGIEDARIVVAFLIFSSIIESIALLFATFALGYIISGNEKRARSTFFLSIVTSLFLFSFFTVGDQIFGDRVELLEHSTFWLMLLVSWFVYTHFRPSDGE